MKYADLRDFMSQLQQNGELKRVTIPVSPYLEMTEVCDRTLRAGGPALLFEQPTGHSIPVLANLFGTPQRVALGMGADDVSELRRIGHVLARLKEPEPPRGFKDILGLGSLVKAVWDMAPKEVKGASCQEIVWEGQDVDLGRLPIQHCWPGDIAPLLYLAIGGVPLAMCYKAINTLDSMVGYKNDRYLYFGRASAKLDDIVNWIPARLAGLLTVLCAFLVGLDGKNAWKIYRRDCHNHASPNSAQTESACAGALQVQLAGDAYYFGKLCHKPTIGDPIRPVKPQDIVLANRLMVASDLVFAALCCAAWAMVYWLI